MTYIYVTLTSRILFMYEVEAMHMMVSLQNIYKLLVVVYLNFVMYFKIFKSF